MTKARTKTRAANLSVPQTREEAARAIVRIGSLTSEATRIQADLDDEVRRLKESAEAAARPLAEEAEALTEGLRIWAEANRAKLTDGNKVKYADLGVGKILWRFKPPKVSIRGAETIVETLRSMGLGRFIRTKDEVDRDAMLREPDVARAVPGITIGSDGEDFIVEPLQTELSTGGA